MRIFHFSDFHICNALDFSALRSKRFFGWLNWCVNRCRKHKLGYLDKLKNLVEKDHPDVLCMTGDFSQLGTFSELEAACQFFSSLKTFTKKILIVPGNHDRYITDEKASKLLAQIISEYGLEKKEEVFSLNGSDFIPLDQTFCNKLFHFNGKVREGGLLKLERALQENPQNNKIVLGHFPLVREDKLPLAEKRRLFGAEDIMKITADSDLLYLCGHIHKPFACKLQKGLLQLCAGSVTMTGSLYDISINPGENFKYKLISLEED